MKRSITTLTTLTFAYITFIGAVLFSVASNAAVHESGTFVPVVCGAAVSDKNGSAISKVCMGRIADDLTVGSMGAYEFRDADGNPAVYRVDAVQNLLIKLYTGETATKVFLVGPAGDRISMSVKRMGDIPTKASGQIGDARFVVPKFEQAMVTL